MISTDQGICTCGATDVSTLIKIFGSRWGRACGKVIRASSRTTSNTFKMAL